MAWATMVRVVLLAAALGAAAPAAAAEWWIILQQDGEGNVHMGETGQMRRENGKLLFWTEIHYRKPVDEMKSARIQFEVDCSRSALRERRYIDFDVRGATIGAGDNTSEDGWREVAPDAAGARTLDFACAAATDRKARYLRVAETVDRNSLAEFYMDPRPVVSLPCTKKKPC